MVIPRFVAQALLGDDLTVYGTGTQTRCFCDVSDVVRAVVALLDHPGSVGDAFNVGSSEEVTILEVAERVIAATGSPSRISYMSYADVYGDQYEDMLRRVPDTTKIRNLLGWRSEHDLDSIIKRTIAWAQTVGPETMLR
jgi:UDP-glucose 4-epimerase